MIVLRGRAEFHDHDRRGVGSLYGRHGGDGAHQAESNERG
jgi:hypothetical protein